MDGGKTETEVNSDSTIGIPAESHTLSQGILPLVEFAQLTSALFP